MAAKDTDKLYGLICIDEKQDSKALGFDKENMQGRPSACMADAVDVSKPMITDLEQKCVGEDMNKNSLCTYNGNLEFIGKKRTSCSSEMVWNHIVDFINRTNFNFVGKKTNFFIVSHHNRLKQTILGTILKAEKKLKKKLRHHIANCSCFLLEYTEKGWTFTLIFDGFPDKSEYTYFVGPTPKQLFGPEDLEDKKGWNLLVSFLNYIEYKEQTRIFLIRHGNAFHNKPLKLTGPPYNRTVDTNLTPLGIYQARILGESLFQGGYLKPESDTNINIFCASYLNRAQHTLLGLNYALNVNKEGKSVKTFFGDPPLKTIEGKPPPSYPKLLALERFFTDFAISRLIRKSKGIPKFFENIHKLAMWKNNFKAPQDLKLIPESKRNSPVEKETFMMDALTKISAYSLDEWDEGRFCKSYAVNWRPPGKKERDTKIGAGRRKKTKRKRRRKKRRKRKTKRKRK
jgi:broad specificity phosphatase PhoE